jgi:hypothetical protein
MATAVLFGLVSTGFASIAMVKAPHNFPSHRAVTAKSYVANRSPTARSDHVALLIANSNYPDADSPLPEVAAGADLLANVLHSHGFVVDVVRDATRGGAPRLGRAGLFWRIRSPVERPKLHDPRRRKDLGGA